MTAASTALAAPTAPPAPSVAVRLRRVVAADLVVLRRRALLLGTYAAVALVTVLITMLSFATAGDEESFPPGPGAQGVTLADLEAADGVLTGLTSAVGIFGVIAVCVAAAHLAGMFATGTIRNTLVRSPGRVVLVAGKTVAVSIFLLGAVAVAAVVAVATAYASAPMAGADTAAWTDSLGDLAAGIGYVALAVVGYGVIGMALGLLIRTPIPAVAIGIGWLLPLETIMIGTVDGAERWLPGQLLSAIAAGGTDDVALGAGLTTLVAYLVVGMVAATARFVRGDVTS